MQALPRFRGDCDVRVWLCRIARNTYFSTRRDPDNQPMEEPGEERAGSAPSPEEETLRRPSTAWRSPTGRSSSGGTTGI